MQVGFRSPSGQHVWGIFDIQHPLSGHQLDGTFQATVQLPANAEAGTWTVEWFLVADEAGNQKFLYPTDTPVLGSTTFQVSNSASDSAMFSVALAQASQSEGKSVTTADTCTVTLDEDGGGALTPSDSQSQDSVTGLPPCRPMTEPQLSVVGMTTSARTLIKVGLGRSSGTAATGPSAVLPSRPVTVRRRTCSAGLLPCRRMGGRQSLAVPATMSESMLTRVGPRTRLGRQRLDPARRRHHAW